MDWAKRLELTTNTVAQCVRQQNSSVHATINDSQELAGFSLTGSQRKQENNLREYFRRERARNRRTECRSHNDDVTTVNGRLPDDCTNEAQTMTSRTRTDEAQTIRTMSRTR